MKGHKILVIEDEPAIAEAVAYTLRQEGFVVETASDGLVGLGETFFAPASVETYVHEILAPKLIGRDPRQIDRIAKDVSFYLGFRSAGVEMRAHSALEYCKKLIFPILLSACEKWSDRSM